MYAQRRRGARHRGDRGRGAQTRPPHADLLADDPRVELAAQAVPAREVGGDLYDFFMLDDRRLFFLVGDVAGQTRFGVDLSWRWLRR